MNHEPLNTGSTSFQSLHQPNIQKLQHVFHDTRDWLLRAGKSGISKFFLGLIRRTEDETVLRKLIILLSSASQKDYIYTRSRSNPGLANDIATKPWNKEFSSEIIKECAAESMKWFQEADDHCRWTFMLSVANLCVDTGIAHQACNLCKTLLHRRKADLILKQETRDIDIDGLDTSSITSSRYSYHTDEHPDVYDIATIASEYGMLDIQEQDDSRLLQATPSTIKITKSSARNSLPHTPQSASSTSENEYSRVCLITTSHAALSGISQCCDFIALLPVHLSKNILGMLSKKDLSSCALVHETWHQLVSQVRSDEFHLQIIKEEAILMQGVSAIGSNPTRANIRRVLVPVVDDVTEDVKTRNIYSRGTDRVVPKMDGEEELFESLFIGLETKYVEVEERNLYCGAYNLLVLDQRSNSNRVISYSGGDNLVIGSTDKVIRTVDISSGRDKKPSMHGHPASVTALYMGTKDQGSVYSGSYDTTVRKWNINTGYCQSIMHGHRSSVNTLDLSGNILVSGSLDGLVKAWNVTTGNCLCTFKHTKKFSVTCVQVRGDTIVSACERGLVKVWSLKSRRIVKTLNNHGGMKVNCVRFDDNFLLSGGNDDYLLLWSMPGRQKICLKAFRHPQPVLCLEFKYMCAISGCADGKIRVLNIFTGESLRVLRGNSQCDPIVNIVATEDRLLVNTSSNCLVMHFEPVEWKYDHPAAKAQSRKRKEWEFSSKRPVSSTILHSVARAKRLGLASASDKRVFKRTYSAPPQALQKSTLISGRRPASHYIDLQPEFRRPRSGVTSSVMSVRNDSSVTDNVSKCPSRLVSATSTRRSVSLKSGSRSKLEPAPSPKIWPLGNKHTQLARDGVLMRVGMLSNVRKNEEHNVNTEMNSISYFDRMYPKREDSRVRSAATAHTADAFSRRTVPKVYIGKFSTQENEICEIKSVLKEGYSPDDVRRRSRTAHSEPILDPLRLNFALVSGQDERYKRKEVESPLPQVDQFLHRQLGVKAT